MFFALARSPRSQFRYVRKPGSEALRLSHFRDDCLIESCAERTIGLWAIPEDSQFKVNYEN